MDVKAVAILASLFAAAVVTAAGLLQPPMYEASAWILVDESSPAQETGNGKIQLIPNAPTPERLRVLTQTTIITIEARPVAKEAIRRLGLGITPDELLDNLRARQVEGTGFIRISYEHPNVVVAADVVNTMANVSSERISDTSNLTATVHEKARVPDYPAPVSPNPLRNGLITLVASLALSAVLIAGHSWAGSATFGIRPRR